MSFSADTKNEIARTFPKKKCCELAEIAGFLRVSGSLKLEGGGRFTLVVTTDSPAVARHYKRMIQDYFNIDTRLVIEEATPPRQGYLYRLTINPEMRSESVLRETGILLVRQGNNYLSDGIYDNLIRTKCCKKAYLRGLFIGSGSITDPNKGYHMEIVCDTRTLAGDVKKLINSFENLSAKIVVRKENYVVYLKNSQNIRDVLAIIDAHAKVLEFEDIRIRKDLMNRTVRIINCDAANTDRTVEASHRQMVAINILKETGKYDKLSPRLKETADLRLEYPEASLTQLGEMMDPPVKKSAIGNRMNRLVKMGKQAEEEKL